MLEIGTGEAVSVISNLGQETQAPGSLISSVRNWPFFRFATCGGHKTALMCAHETCMRHVRPIICTVYPSTHMHCTVAIVHVPLVVLHCALAVSSGVISLCWLVLLRHIWVELPVTKTTIMASISDVTNSNDIYSNFLARLTARSQSNF